MHRLVTPLGTTYDEEPGEVKLVVAAHATCADSDVDAGIAVGLIDTGCVVQAAA